MATLEEIKKAINLPIYYEEPCGIIYNMDCMKVLPKIPEKSIDLVLTDPPYGVNGGSGTKGKMRANKHNYKDFDDTPQNVINQIIPRFIKFLEICQRAIITPGSLVCNHYPQPDSIGSLVQWATSAMQKWGRCDSQPIFYYGRDPRLGKTIDFCSYENNTFDRVDGFPCPKPIKIWSKLLTRGSLEGEIILDPFLGSGTTAIAAKQLGRQFIGIEISEKYCEIAVQRLAQDQLL